MTDTTLVVLPENKKCYKMNYVVTAYNKVLGMSRETVRSRIIAEDSESCIIDIVTRYQKGERYARSKWA